MKKSSVLILLIMVVFSQGAAAQGEGFGFGIIAGEPTGLSFKNWLGYRTAFDVAAAWSFSDEAAVNLHADYLIHTFGIFKPQRGRLPIYYGIGGRVKFANKSELGIRIPVGLDYLTPNGPIDFFVEIAPILNLAPDTDFRLAGAVGVRYFF